MTTCSSRLVSIVPVLSDFVCIKPVVVVLLFRNHSIDTDYIDRMKYIQGYDLYGEVLLPWQMLVKMTIAVSSSLLWDLPRNCKENIPYLER